MSTSNDHCTEALDRLRSALLGKVHSAVLYGSYVHGDFRAATSDINLAIVVEGSDLSPLGVPLREAWRAARVNPWIARLDELPGLSDVFATRIRGLQRRHRVLLGENPWAALVVSKAALRLRVEQGLRNHQLRLRRAMVLSDAAGQSRQLHAAAGALLLDLAVLVELAGGVASESIAEVAAAAAARIDVAYDDVLAVLQYRVAHEGDLGSLLAKAANVLDRAVAHADNLKVP